MAVPAVRAIQRTFMTKFVRADTSMALSSAEKSVARANIGAPGTEVATTSANGLMSASDKSRVDAAAAASLSEFTAGASTTLRSISATMLRRVIETFFGAADGQSVWAIKARCTVRVASNVPSITSAGNVSAVTYLSTGKLRVSFNTPFPHGNYQVVGSWTNGSTTSSSGQDGPVIPVAKATDYVDLLFSDGAGVLRTPAEFSIIAVV